MSYAYLLEQARRNVWCAPDQDNQILLTAQKITVPGGERVSFPIMQRRLALPTQDHRYHVYQIGQVTPTVMGLLPPFPSWARGQWTLFSAAVEGLPLFVSLYTDLGVHIPITRTYYMYTQDKALIFAVEVNPSLSYDIETERLYLRLYRNAYFATTGAISLQQNTRAGGAFIQTTQDILTLQTQITALRQRQGAVLCFRNGQHVSAITPLTTQIGDYVEYIYDASVKRTVDFLVSDLLTFTSTLDDAFKYLLHPPGAGESLIDYVDDVDIYVMHLLSGGRFVGRYYHRNLASAQRMVTHRDYSIRTDHYAHIAQGLESFLGLPQSDLRGYTLRLYIRHSGLPRPLVYENQRIFELYKLQDDRLLGAMVGVNATVPVWTASALEASGYTELMRAKYEAIDIDLVERAYGYNGLTKVLGDTPTKTVTQNSEQIVSLPIGLYENSTMYEYDATGTLLGFHHHLYGTIYHPVSPQCRMVEGIVGLGSQTPSVVYGADHLPLPTKYSYRVYMCYLVSGQPNNAWVDITGDDQFYSVEAGQLVWTSSETDQWLMVRTDERFLAYELEVSTISGTLYFDLSEVVEGEHRLMTVPMYDLDLWLNGKALIEDLDYQVRWPRVYIVNKRYLAQPANTTPQKVTVRFTGLAAHLQRKPVEDCGFVEHGLLSNNDRFDVRDDKVLRITLDGSLKHRSDLEFSENSSAISISHALNGQPYQIKDIVVPLRDYSAEETYALRSQALEIDTAVENYLTQWYPEPDRGEINAIPNKYPVVSPFFSQLINDLAAETFNMTALEDVLSDQAVIELCSGYTHLLEVDPINADLGYDLRYVLIQPHQLTTTIGLSLYAYRFIQRVLVLYGQGKLSLSSHLTVNLGA